MQQKPETLFSHLLGLGLGIGLGLGLSLGLGLGLGLKPLAIARFFKPRGAYSR